MTLPDPDPDPASDANSAITPPRCSIDSCGNEARWRQFNPPSRAHPLFLCTDHWLQVRLDRPELIVAYGWLTSFTKKELSDPYGMGGTAEADSAAYEIPLGQGGITGEIVGGKTE